MKKYADNNEVLVEALKTGEEESFIYLFNTFSQKLFVYAKTMVNDQTIAQDIVQEVFLKTWQFRKNLKSEYSIQSFLYKCVHNEFIKRHHKRKSMMLIQKKYIEALTEITEETNSTELEKMICMIRREIDTLPLKCKEIFELSKFEGLSNKEIADYLNISIKTVENHKTRAYSMLRNKLEDIFNKIVLFFIY